MFLGKPDRGAYVEGLFMQGAQWDQMAEGCAGGGDIKSGAIIDSSPRVLFTPMPSFWLVVEKGADIPKRHAYTCPTYKTSLRQGKRLRVRYYLYDLYTFDDTYFFFFFF